MIVENKFKRIINENFESDEQSDLYSRNADELVEFVQNKLLQRNLSSDDKKRIIDLMKAYGKRMFYKGKQESEGSLPFADEKAIYDVKNSKKRL